MTKARAVGVYALTAGCLLVGCGETPSDAQRRPRGLMPGEATSRASPAQSAAVTEPQAEPPSAPPSSLPSPFVPSAPNPGALRVPDAGSAASAATGTESADAGATTPPRDLSNELRILLGQPAACLDLAAVESAGGKAVVSATANVVPSGRITRATVTTPGQPSTALRCLEQRLTAGSLKGPIPGAPLTVSTSIPIEVVSSARP